MFALVFNLATHPATQRTTENAGVKVAAGGALAGGMLLLVIFGLIVLFFLHFIPSFIAVSRGHPNTAAIVILNLVAGWTFIGFVAALVWSFTAIPQKRKRYGPSDDDLQWEG